MTLYKANKQMMEWFGQKIDGLCALLPPKLKELIGSGLIDVRGCICLRSLLEKAHVDRSSFPDSTGYECFVNSIHIDDFCSVDVDKVAVGIAFLDEISNVLQHQFPARHFQGIIAADDTKCTVRFHTMRADEQWLVDDLDKYDERVCVMDL